MIKDIVVNLVGPRRRRTSPPTMRSRWPRPFGAHVAGVAFVYEPVIPDGTLGGVPIDLIEVQREENTKAAKTRGRAGSRRRPRQAGVSAETAHARRQLRRRGRPVRPHRRGASISRSSGRRSASTARPKS